nr:sulfur carrier protein ThiS [Clostridia bacterium]
MVIINGKEYSINGITLAEYLKTTNYDVKRIAVELNGDIVPKASYSATVLLDGDHVEIVSFVGGGT